MNQCIYMFMKRMCIFDETNFNQLNQNIFKQFGKVCKLLHINELEMAIWSLYLDKLGWKLEGISLEMYLILTGIQSKQYANSEAEVNIYINKLNDDYPHFKELYEDWIKDEDHKINFSVKDIGTKFNRYQQVNQY